MPVIGSTSSVRQHAVSITGIEGMWATCKGGDVSIAVSESYNGGAKVPDITKGRVSVANVIVDRPYNPMRDSQVLRDLASAIGGTSEYTITDQDLDANDMAIGSPRVYTGCVPVKITSPDYDEQKSDASRVTVEFKVRTKT